MTPRLHIFNPEHEFALASGSPYYTPPRRIVSLRKEKALMPAIYAHEQDAILIPSESDPATLEHYQETLAKHISILRPDENIDWSIYAAEPWGWNHHIAHYLNDHCPGLTGIPSTESLDVIRQLSHRRTTIKFLEAMPAELMRGISLPLEFNNASEATDYYKRHPGIFVKAPWSSSGRGVMRTDDLELRHVEPWIRGTVRSQGSVIIEAIYDKSLDFATEWEMQSGVAKYIGLSIFEASGRGKYHHNIIGSQDELTEILAQTTDRFDASIIQAQKETLQDIIGNHYNGPLGIDMLVTVDRRIHPCIEINLRHTMGSILINKS